VKARRALARLVWRIMNPLALRLAAGIAPWWVILETTGRKSGRPRRVPLARGPAEGRTVWIVAVHGRHAAFVQNVMQNPQVRIKTRGRWSPGRATVEPFDPQRMRDFNLYARLGPRTLGIDPALVRIELD
jgi:deazaflavin-dependent oxidoreductase (nitroreductase family)